MGRAGGGQMSGAEGVLLGISILRRCDYGWVRRLQPPLAAFAAVAAAVACPLQGWLGSMAWADGDASRPISSPSSRV